MEWDEALEEAEEEYELGMFEDEDYEGVLSKNGNELSPTWARAVEILRENKAEKKAAYEEYLKSDWWKAMRLKVLCRDGFLCVKCHDPAQCVHHKSYENKGTEEEYNDCISLCNYCHKETHGISIKEPQIEVQDWYVGRK